MIAIWDLKTGKEVLSWPSRHGEVWTVEYSPDGKYLLTASSNHPEHGAQLWEAETGKLVRDWLIGPTSSATFSPNGKRFLTAEVNSQVRLWDVDAQVAVRQFVGHEKWVTHGTFSPDGKTALSAGYDNTVRLWKLPE
jgi:WD40 repeat protein